MDNQYIRRLRIQKKSGVKKLYAAVCMVLIAALLVSATSYAWLVLSQAPEVSNVTTTIGANGNLEIALGKNIGESTIGDSFNKNDVTIANRTWGNLIDLTDESYGLQAITLRPAILNSAGGAINMLHPLAYPIYGANGRVQYIYANNMFAGTYNGNQFVTSANDYGVHGIGTTQYHAPGVEGTFGPLSQRQEIYYNAKNNLWTMTHSSWTSLCESSQSVLRAYCTDGTGVSASDFNLDTFSQRVADVVSAANEELRLVFALLAASESTSADNYFLAMDLLEQEYPDYETIRSLVASAIQTEEAKDVGTAIAELWTFQDASNQLQAVIASEVINCTDGYSREELAQTVGLIFDLEKTNFNETSKDYWCKFIPNLHYRKYLDGKYWWNDLDGLAMDNLTSSLYNSDGQDNDSREATVYEIAHTHTYSIYQSLPLEKLDPAIAGLYASHWIYWDNHAEEYKILQDEITDLEAQVKQLEDSGASEADIQLKTAELSDKQEQLQSLIDGEIYALDDDRLEAIQTVMADTVEAMRQYTLWAIAYCACDGRVPDDAYHHILEIASSNENVHPRIAYQALCNYGVKPQEELTNMVASFEKLEKDLLFLQSESSGADSITWSELSEELQRIFGILEHRLYFVDNGYIHDIYANSILIEDTPFPIEVMDVIRAEIDKCEAAIGTVTKSNAKHRITYRYLDEENKQPWAQALGLLLTVYNAAYPFEYGTAEYTLADQPFSTEHNMWYEQGFQLSISVGVGSEDNFNESGLTVRQTQFKDAQENISYYQNQLITAAVNPGKDMAALLMQIIVGEGSVSLVTISEYLDNLRQQLEYGEAMMYQATLVMAASNYAEDNVYEYAYSDRAPSDAAGMIELLRSYNFDATVLTALDQRMALLNTQKALLNQSLALLKNYQNSETGALKVEQISATEAVALLNPVLDTEGMTLYGYVAESDDDSIRYVRTVLFAGYGFPSVQINGNQAIVSGREPVTIFGNIYLSLGDSFSGGMLALAKSETEPYTSPTGGLSADEIAAAEKGANRRSYTIDAGTELLTLNLRTADTPYSLATNLWTYTGNTQNISANQVLVDVYGYSIDLSFRTNADNSDLLLQTEAVDRIYNDGDPYSTSMGAGSYMEFEILDPSYTAEMAKEYMSFLRVVLTDTNTGYIYGYAALDMTAAEVIGVTVKAPLRLYNKDSGLMIEGDTAQYICHLDKNLEKNLTVYVYLDGANATQALASATHEQTLSGVMNIQFCSSADLKPAFSGDGVTDNGGSQTPTNPSNPGISDGVIEYNVYVSGIQVTSANANDVFGDGTTSYEPDTNTLMINGAVIEGSSVNGSGFTYGIYSSDELNIVFGDDNTIIQNCSHGIQTNGSLTIGGGTLIIQNVSIMGIYTDQNDATINGGTITINMPQDSGHAICTGAVDGTLTINAGEVILNGGETSSGDMYGLASLNIVLGNEAHVIASGGTRAAYSIPILDSGAAGISRTDANVNFVSGIVYNNEKYFEFVGDGFDA